MTGLAYSPDGRLLATVRRRSPVPHLDARRARAATLIPVGPQRSAQLGRLPPRQSIPRLRRRDQVVKLWRLERGSAKEAQNFRGHRDWVTTVAFSKDGFYVVSSGGRPDRQGLGGHSKELPLSAEHTGSVEAVAVSPDGKLIASGATDESSSCGTRATGIEVMTLPGHARGGDRPGASRPTARRW